MKTLSTRQLRAHVVLMKWMGARRMVSTSIASVGTKIQQQDGAEEKAN